MSRGITRTTMMFHRASQRLHAHGSVRRTRALGALATLVSKVDLDPSAEVHDTVDLAHGQGLVVGAGVVVGPGCVLHHEVSILPMAGGAPVLGRDVMVYPGARILGPVVVGDGATVGANAVVLEDVPAGAVAFGVALGTAELWRQRPRLEGR